jgi:hypothetical protein
MPEQVKSRFTYLVSGLFMNLDHRRINKDDAHHFFPSVR